MQRYSGVMPLVCVCCALSFSNLCFGSQDSQESLSVVTASVFNMAAWPKQPPKICF